MITKTKPKRSRAAKIMLFPVLALIFLMGIIIYTIGEPKKPAKIKNNRPKVTKEDNSTLLPIILEKEQEITQK